jgi:hypothetical protein
MTIPRFHGDYIDRHGPEPRAIPRLEPLFVRVADVSNAADFPNIAAALEHTRSQQGGSNHG